MTFRGIVRNGKIELDVPSDLPEGASVDVNLRSDSRPRPKKSRSGRDPVFHISDLAVPSGRTDGAAEHDHYIYGTPKKSSRRSRVAPAKNSKTTRARR